MKRATIISISLLFLAIATFAEVSGERPISEPAYGPPPGQRYGAAAASDGHDFLVAWVDSQRSRANINQIYATRMNAAGDILDPLGIRLPTTLSQVARVDVVFLGDSYLVYWDEPSRISPFFSALMAARISRDGILLDSTPRMLADRAQVNVHGAASNGNRTVIVFGGQMVILDRSGNIVDGPKAISPDSAASSAMVTSNGREFMAAWQRGTIVTSVRLDPDGALISTSALATTTELLDLASDGDSYVAIVRNGSAFTAQHIRVSGETLEKSAVTMLSEFPGFVFAGGSYLLMDSDQHSIGVRRLDRTGQPIGSYFAVSSGQSFGAGATLASNGSDAGFFWTEWATSVQSFNGTVVNGQSLAAAKTTAIARSANTQRVPDAATSGRNSAIVWSEDDGVYAGRLSLDGQPLDGRGIRIGNRGLEPHIAFDGTNYLIAWTEQPATNPPSATVKIARLSPDSGALLDPSGIVVGTNDWSSGGTLVGGVALAPNGSSTLVTWSGGGRIVANTVAHDGTLGTPVTVSPAKTGNTGSVSAAWNGHEWLVVWEDLVGSTLFLCDPVQCYDVLIKASRLSPSLTVLDPNPISISDTRFDSRPLVASNGDGFLIVWSRSASPGVIAQRISSDGSLLAQANGVGLVNGSARSVAWDGVQYDVALSSVSQLGHTLYVTHVAATGSIESLTPLAVVTNAIDPSASLFATGLGRTTTVYTRLGNEPLYGDVERAFVSVPHAIRGRAAR